MSLYSKYRPRNFRDLVGQDHVAQTLERALEQDKLSHSYLFCGSRGVGKTTVARILAQGANCSAKKEKPCGKCRSCLTVAKGSNSDILELDAASNRGIDEIRSLREKVQFAPSFGRYKVYIIDEVHMLTKEAFNALLKTLEEPPSHAVFILATTEAHKVPATIVSRCQRFDFHRATTKSVLELLSKVAQAENIAIEEEGAVLIARAADGAYRDALTLLEQISLNVVAGKEEQAISADTVRAKLGLIAEPLMWQLLTQVAGTKKEEAIKTLYKFIEQGADWRFIVNSLLEKLRHALFFAIAPSVVTADLTAQEKKYLALLAKTMEEEGIVKLINLLLQAQEQLRYASLPEVPVACALARYFDSASPASFKTPVPPKATVPQKEKTPLAESGEKEAVAISEQVWGKIVEAVKENNSTLAGLLAQSRPYLASGNLIIEVPYKFWEERIKNSKNNKAICKAACQVLGEAIKLALPKPNGAIKKTLNEAMRQEDKAIKDEIADVFG